MSRHVSFIVSDEAYGMLEQLSRMGLWGEDPDEAAMNLVYTGLQDAMAKKFVIAPGQDEDPEAPPVPTGARWKCETCMDGGRLLMPPEKVTSGGTCADCGTLLEIPF